VIRRTGLAGGVRAARGFTLLEVLLAFVIFALSFATVLEIMGASVRSTTRARDYTEAALLAQSVMDMVGMQIPLAEGASGGEAHGGYRWELVISPYQPLSAEDRSLELAEVAGTMLYWVDLDVSWGDPERPREARFTTVRAILANQQ
jgi:general secretion pathway protein I